MRQARGTQGRGYAGDGHPTTFPFRLLSTEHRASWASLWRCNQFFPTTGVVGRAHGGPVLTLLW